MTAPVSTLEAVVHGSVTDAELAHLGRARSELLDLSSNLHPDGPDPAVLAAFRAADVTHYPEPGAEPLRSLLAAHHRLEPEQLLVTAGATAAIHLALRALLRPGDACALFPPTFGEYEAAVRLTGATVTEYLGAPPDFAPPEPVSTASLGVLCNPNNPTGAYLERSAVESLAAQLGGPLLLDVAYDAFVDEAWDADALPREGAPVVVVHSMTKLHAIPGLRLGYVTGPAALIARLEAAQPSWSVGAPALAAGIEALRHDAARRAAIDDLRASRARLRGAFERAEVECAPSQANFVLARVGDASAFRARLIEVSGVAVRDTTSFGLPDWIRIAVPARAALPRVLQGLNAVLTERHQ
ncbi:MAG: histidinol-phosphate transaminase [Chloroflexi bacterium]|nr:histidinol-phosphate transaminase [Chloroflexota bacterium]MDA1146270.1 histidinol-phosphate transaminase [Chloroflexota bacterium]